MIRLLEVSVVERRGRDYRRQNGQQRAWNGALAVIVEVHYKKYNADFMCITSHNITVILIIRKLS